MMRTWLLRHSMLAFVCLIAAAAPVSAQQGRVEYTPQPHQEGKDVAWVPTEQVMVEAMLDMAGLTPGDYLIDLGSGDGRTVITAAKRGARALGVEYNPLLVALAKAAAVKEGVADRARFMEANLYDVDISQGTVITLFLLTEINLKLRPRILNLKPGTRVVSNTFQMGDWKPDRVVDVERKDCENGFCTAYFWVVPPRVHGTWMLQGAELTVDQSYQYISGTLKSGDRTRTISNGTLRGADISFAIGDTEYTGKVDRTAMGGEFRSPKGSGEWRATRISE